MRVINTKKGDQMAVFVLEDLEAELVMADVGVEATERIVSGLNKRLARKELKDVDALRQGLEDALVEVRHRLLTGPPAES